MKTLQIGLVGCGVMGRILAVSLAKVNGAQLAMVCDLSHEAAHEAAQQLNVPCETDVAKIISNETLDAVIVAPPPFEHRRVCVAAAQAGKHVFVEKPLATNLADCDAIITAASNAKITLMVGQVCRYHAIHSTVKQMVDDGAIGRPIFMHVYRIGGGWGPGWNKPWRNKRSQCGGSLMEINAHEIDFMRFVCGDVKRVVAVGGTYLNHEADYPDLAALSLHFASGAIGFLHASQVSTIDGYGGRIDGTEGSLVFPMKGKEAGIHHKRAGAEPGVIPASEIQVPNPVVTEIEAWLGAIRNGTAPPIPGTEGRAAVQIAAAAYESIDTGMPVELSYSN